MSRGAVVFAAFWLGAVAIASDVSKSNPYEGKIPNELHLLTN